MMAVPAAERRSAPTSIAAVRLLRKLIVYVLLVIAGIVFTFPFFWLLTTSVKAEDMIMVDPPQWIPNPLVLSNYPGLFQAAPVLDWIVNSATVTFIATLGVVISSVFVAYGFARLPFPGSRALFFLVLSTMMLPAHVTIIPRFVMFREVHWLDTLLPLVVPPLFGSAFYIFLLRQFFMTLPRDLDEAAEVDGANSLQILWYVLAPLARAAMATVAIFAFVANWSDFFEPFIYLSSPEKLTLQVGLQWFNTQYGTRFGLLMTGAVISMAPPVIVFFFAQKQFIQGIALTGIKS